MPPLCSRDLLNHSCKCVHCGLYMQVHGDYSEDVGAKVDRPADDTMAEAPAELVGAWMKDSEIAL